MQQKSVERANAAASAAVLAAAVALAAVSDRSWSWPLFVWGPVIGVAAVFWAYSSTRLFARYLQARTDPRDAASIGERSGSLWSRRRSAYLTTIASGVAVGIVAGGLHSPGVDIGVAVLWVVFGVLPAVVASPVLARRAGTGHGG